MSLTLRGIKGSALTHGELDNNFIWLSSRDIVAAVIDSNSNLILTKEDSSYYSVPLSGVNTYISGLTFSGNVLTITQSDGVSVSVNISSVDIRVTDLVYSADTLILYQSDGSSETVLIPQFSGGTINGPTNFTNGLSANTFNTTSLILNGVTITGFTSYDYTFTGGTVTGPTNFTNGLSANTFNTTSLTLNGVSLTAITDTFVTGFTYNGNNTFIISQNQGQPDLTATINSVTGLTVNGNLVVTGNTALQSLSATSVNTNSLTLNNVTITGFTSYDYVFTGGTVTGPTNFINGLSATSVNTNSLIVNGITYTAITDTFVTGFTYNDANRLTISRNQGQSDLNVFINTFSGLTVNGTALINGDVNILGNVNVIGTATTLNTQVVQTRDNKILLNYSGTNLTAIGGGIEVLSAKTDGNNVSLTTDINGDWNSNTGFIISGRTSDSTTNGLKVVNSSGTNNLVVRNDGKVGINTSNPNYQLEVLPKDLTGTTQVVIRNTSTSPNWTPVGLYVQDGSGYGVSMSNSSNGADAALTISSGSYSYLNHVANGNLVAALVTAGDYLLWRLPDNFDFRRRATNYTWLRFDSLNQNLSIFNETSTPPSVNSRLGVRGSDSSSSNYGLKVQNSGGTDNLVVRNDGNVGIGTSVPSEKLHVVGNTKITGGLNIGTIGSGSPLINLGLDSLGNVVTGTTGGGGGTFTGGTVSGPTNFTNGLTANTFNTGSLVINGITYTAITDTFTTGFTYDNNNKLTISRNQGQPDLNIFINTMSGLTVNGPLTVTGTTELKGVIKNTGSRLVFGTGLDPETDRSQTLGTSTKSWGNVYTELLTLEDSSGADQVILSVANQTVPGDIALEWELPPTTGSVGTFLGVWNLNGTKSKSTWFTISAGTNINLNQQIFSGGSVITINSTAFGGTFTGGTVSGDTTFTSQVTANGGLTTNGGLTANAGLTATSVNTGSVSTSSLNLNGTIIISITDNYVTGGTINSSGTLTLNRQNGSVTISGFTTGYTLTSSAISSALGYSPLSATTDTFVTGFTYNDSNKLTISQNQGKDNIDVFINTMSGLTVNGNLIVSAKTTTLNLTSVNDALINGITVGKGDSSVSTNTAVGFNALSKNTIGDKNVALGYGTLSANTIGYSNVSVGVNSLKSNIDGTYNIAIGENALLASTGASTNIAIGWDSMAASNIDADNSHSIGIGVKSLYKNIGISNIGIGYSTLVNNTSGLNNIAIGYVALENNVSGSQNIAIGNQSGVDVQFSALTNTVVIGSNAKVTQSNSIILGNASDTNIKVGIGTAAPSEKLEVSGKTKTTTLQVTNGATAGYVLTATDNLGNMSWQTPTGGGTFTGGTVSGPTNFTNGLTANTLTVGTFSVSRKFSSSESFTGSVTKTITHNLNTQDVIVQLWDSSNNLLNGATIVTNNVNSVDITVATTATYKVVIIG